MTIVLVVLAFLVGGVGLLTMSQATMGVGLMGGACLLGIMARIYQAMQQHETLTALLKDKPKGISGEVLEEMSEAEKEEEITRLLADREARRRERGEDK